MRKDRRDRIHLDLAQAPEIQASTTGSAPNPPLSGGGGGVVDEHHLTRRERHHVRAILHDIERGDTDLVYEV